jgi:hypothetical protein
LVFVSELTVTGALLSVFDCVVPSSLDAHVTVYPVMALPPVPLSPTATIAELLPRVTLETEGAGGFVPATKELDATDAALSPMEFVATTAHVYVRPFDNEVTVSGELTPVLVRVVPPVLDVQVTLKKTIASPPSVFAVNATMAEFEPRVTPVIVGASGTVMATKSSDGSDAALSPLAFVATTVQPYVLPFVSELTVIGDAASVFVCVVPPSLDTQVTVYAVIGSPPSSFGLNPTETVFRPIVMPVIVGASGALPPLARIGVALTHIPNVITTSATVPRRIRRTDRRAATVREKVSSLFAMAPRSTKIGPAQGDPTDLRLPGTRALRC